MACYTQRRKKGRKMAYDLLKIKQDDYDGDAQTNSLRVEDVTSAGSYATFDTQTGALAAALDLWTIGRPHAQSYEIRVADNGPGKASSPIAQSKSQLILETQDAVSGVIYRERVAFPHLGKADDGGGDEAWIAQGQGQNSLTVINPLHADWTTLKNAYDACGRSPEGNAAVLVRAYIEE